MMEPAALIAEIKQTVENAFANLEQWIGQPKVVRAYHPQDGGWTIDEIFEHVALTNKYLLILISKGTAKALKNLGNLNLGTEIATYEFNRARLDEIGRHRSFS